MANESYIRTANHLTISFSDGEVCTVYPSNPQYTNIVIALKEKDYKKARKLANPVDVVKQKIEKIINRGIGNVELKSGVVYYNGQPIHNTLTNRIVSMANEGFDIEPMCNFLANLQENPSYRAVNELYEFLEKGNLPITEDGYFLAYKRVRNDYTDCHTGTLSNAIGQIVEMPRNKVNENPNETCSSGLHFCSRDYLPHFGTEDGYRTVILKINPADVVAIPTDYNNAKGRTCRYEVIGELKHKNEEHLEGTFRPSENYKAPKDDSFDDDNHDEFDDYYDDHSYAEDDCIVTELVDGVQDAPTNNSIEAIDLDDNTVVATFSNEKEASKQFGTISASAIRRVLRGERKSTGGYGWRFVDKTQPHLTHLNSLHEHGTLKGGQPHNKN